MPTCSGGPGGQRVYGYWFGMHAPSVRAAAIDSSTGEMIEVKLPAVNVEIADWLAPRLYSPFALRHVLQLYPMGETVTMALALIFVYARELPHGTEPPPEVSLHPTPYQVAPGFHPRA